MGKVVFLVFWGLLGIAASTEQKKEADNLADSSVTSYSTVVIHHPVPKNKKGLVKEGEEGGRSQSYFKVKTLRASTVPPQSPAPQNGHNGGDFRLHNHQNGLDPQLQNEKSPDMRPSHSEFKPIQSKAENHKDNFKGGLKDFKPSQYLPESEVQVSIQAEKDQSIQGARHTEYIQNKENIQPEYRRHKYKDENSGERESPKWRHQYHHRPYYQHSEDPNVIQKTKQDENQFHREVFINHDYQPKNEKLRSHPPKQESFSNAGFTYSDPNGNPAYQDFAAITEQRLRPIPPPGMSEELIETLLSQQPQTFDAEPKIPTLLDLKKKPKGQTFKVGYSIGFGSGADDIVLGKPKGVRLHVNGRNSVWKSLPQGVEMSQETDKKKPMALKLVDNSFRASDNVLKNDVYYMQNFKPDTSVPTSGRTSFNHAKAITNSNTFDFSNAMEDPRWLNQPQALQQQVDMGSIYQSLGYPPPLPVLLPGGPRGEGTMVHAIVIPIEQLAGMDYNWANIPQIPMVPISGQPVAQALTLSPIVTAAPVQQSQAPAPQHHHNHQPTQSQPVHTHDKMRFKARTPKHREFLPHNHKQMGSFSSNPIVVAPAPLKRQSELQQELNNILAEEMMRKNHRLPAVGLRPPPAF